MREVFNFHRCADSDHPVLARWSLRRFVVRMLLGRGIDLGKVNVLLQWSDLTTVCTWFGHSCLKSCCLGARKVLTPGMLESLPDGRVTGNFSRMLASVKSPVSFPCQNMLPEYYIKFDWIAISPANKIMCGSFIFYSPSSVFAFCTPRKIPKTARCPARLARQTPGVRPHRWYCRRPGPNLLPTGCR